MIQGHPLSQLHPGQVYQVSEPFGLQLIALDAAVEVRSTDPISEEDIDVAMITGGVHIVPRDAAADRPEKRRRKRR